MKWKKKTVKYLIRYIKYLLKKIRQSKILCISIYD